MIKNIALSFCAVALLASCGGSKKGMNSGSDGASNLQTQFAKAAGSDRVFFDLNKHNISHESKAVLIKQAAWLQEHGSVKATVEGHCDERGTREYNLALGEKRAHHAAKVLEQHGVAKDRVETISYGKERPAVMGEGEAVWKQNRRAVTSVR
jgi:peptidoglycan-associated lipoprotein